MTSSGSITTTGGTTTGVDAIEPAFPGDNNIIINRGLIRTITRGSGIKVQSGNTITNAADASIQVEGRFVSGISSADRNTISNAGSISVEGRDSSGIDAGDNNISIINSGTISTDGRLTPGIKVSSNNPIVTNSGSISTKGDIAHGISSTGSNNVITNEAGGPGDGISTEGERANGIHSNNNDQITNLGNISTEGRDAKGIFARNGNTITNSGSISTTGASAPGFRVYNDNVLTNKTRGLITTGAADSIGISMLNGNELINEAGAAIRTAGANATGIRAGLSIFASLNRPDNGNNRITNDGEIRTGGANAAGIQVVGAKNTVINNGSIDTTGEGAAGLLGITVNTQGRRPEAPRVNVSLTLRPTDTDFTNNGTINTTGVNAPGVRVEDDSEVTNSGDINTKDRSAAGIVAGSSNTLTNNKAITTGGQDANGIQAANNNKITNSGTITVTGLGAAGIRAGDGNELTLSGAVTSTRGSALILGNNNTVNHSSNKTLRASGTNTPAVVLGNSNTLTNTGRIEATGANAHGITAGNNNKITHSGAIAVTGPGSAGIRARDNNELTLSGTVTSAQGSALILGNNNTVNHSSNKTLRSTGTNTPAVVLGSNNTLTNTGRIEATGSGANANAITGDSNNTINNSGVISANGGKAICFTGRNNTLNLLAGSVLRGDICRGANSRVNITVNTAPAYAVLWEDITARPKSGQGIPFFYNARTRQLATYDPRLLAAASQSLGDVSGNISGLMARPVLASSANTRNLSGRAAAFWLSPFGSRARERDSGPAGLSPEFTHLGLAGGYDVRLAATQLGVLAGYGRGERVFEGAQRFKPGPGVFKGPFAGLYARQDFARFYVHLGLAGGTLKHEHSRLVNDQRGLNGETRAEARTRSWWLAPEARIGWRALDTGLARFEPSLSARYARQSIRAYTETGIRAPAAVGRRTVEMVETRLEMKASREVGPGRLALRLGWQYRNDLNSNRTQVRLLGETQSLRFEPKLGSSVYLGAEAEFELAPGLFFSLNGEAVSGGGYRSLSGMASLYMRF